MTAGKDLDVGTRQGKTNRAHGSTFTVRGEGFNVAILGSRGQRHQIMHVEDGGTHEAVHLMFKYGRSMFAKISPWRWNDVIVVIILVALGKIAHI